MYFEDEIIDYIELVRSAVPNAVEVFTQGNCGAFALMLMKTFPGGEIENFSCGHRVYSYRGQSYDITGALWDGEKYKNPAYKNPEPIIKTGKDLNKGLLMLRANYKKPAN